MKVSTMARRPRSGWTSQVNRSPETRSTAFRTSSSVSRCLHQIFLAVARLILRSATQIVATLRGLPWKHQRGLRPFPMGYMQKDRALNVIFSTMACSDLPAAMSSAVPY